VSGATSAIDQTEQVRAGMPFAAYLGVESVSGTATEMRARLAWDERRCTNAGTLHGGALMGIADVLGGIVAFLNLPEGAAGTTTIESKTNFLRPVRSGFVEAVSRPLHCGRTTVVVDTELFDPEARLVARVTQTQAVLYRRE
jgi:1,4-dihydroxy-2-naphthoyl-CoA hydrolase